MGERSETRVETVHATLGILHLPMGLVVDEVIVEGAGVTILQDPFELLLKQSASVTVRIAELSLAHFLENHAPGNLRGFEVKLHDGVADVAAVATVLVPLRVSATCTLELREGKQVWVVLQSVDVMGIGGARGMVEAQIEKINPVFDANELPIDVQLNRVEVKDGCVFLFGNVSPPA